MYRLFALVFISLFVAACTSTEENENSAITNPPNNDLRLIRMDVGYTGPEEPYQYLEYIYDGNGRVDKVMTMNSDGTGETAVSDYEYFEGRVVNIEYSNDSNRSYSYSGDLLVSSVQGNTNFTYGYDSFGRLESITVSQGTQEGCTTTFTYPNSSQPSDSLNDCTSTSTSYTYDTNKNPQYYLFHASFSRIAPLTPNNIKSRTTSDGTTSILYTSEFTYNEEGWPTEIRYFSDGTYISSDRFYYETP